MEKSNCFCSSKNANSEGLERKFHSSLLTPKVFERSGGKEEEIEGDIRIMIFPLDLIALIARHLDLSSLSRLCLANKKINEIINGYSYVSSKLWKRLYKCYFIKQFQDSSENQKPPFYMHPKARWNWRLCFKETYLIRFEYNIPLDPSLQINFRKKQVKSTETVWRTLRINWPISRQSGSIYWEIKVIDDIQGNVCIGVTTNLKPCWQSCLGVDGGWGLLYNGQLATNGVYKPFRANPNSFERITYNKNDTIGVLFNTKEKNISYFKNGNFVGVGFENLLIDEKNCFYPSISISKTEVELVKFQDLSGNNSEEFFPVRVSEQ